MKRLVLILFLSTMASAQDLGSYQKILFPVLSRTTVTGVGGSSFSTPLAVYAPHPITFYWGTLAVSDNIGTSPFPGPIVYRGSEASSHGRVLFFPPEADVAFGYEVVSHGIGVPDDITQLPVVRERDLHTGTSYILNMPVNPNYIFDQVPPRFAGTYKERNTLRIYDVDNTGRLEVDIIYRIIPFSGSLGGPHIVVNRREGDGPSYPTFGELTFDGPCFTGSSGDVCRQSSIMLEIRPNDPSIRYFPMLSTTDNTTQYVTIRVPQ